MRRIVLPEILDSLYASHPEAIRSRRDLKMINFLMGNERWVIRQLHQLSKQQPTKTLFELGAGEGLLTLKLSNLNISPKPHIAGIDFVEKPPHLATEVHWHSGDLFQLPKTTADNADTIISNLFLHHFEFPQIQKIITKFSQANSWIINEPHRTSNGIALSKLMTPFINSITEYDMDLSIRAGFIPGELSSLFPTSQWKTTETIDFRGAYRLVAQRNASSS